MRSLIPILVFLLLVSYGIEAQETPIEKLDFYVSLAMNDAKLEQNNNLLNPEDERDFWNDQINFEKKLSAKNPRAYRAYLSGKHIAYARHQKECRGHDHSPFYFRQASFYAVNGSISLQSEPLLTVENSSEIKIPQSRNIPH